MTSPSPSPLLVFREVNGAGAVEGVEKRGIAQTVMFSSLKTGGGSVGRVAVAVAPESMGGERDR